MAPRAVIFDLWGTLVPFDWKRWHEEFAAIARAIGVSREEFHRAWRGDYERRLVSDLRSSMERVCASLGVTSADLVDEALKLRVEMHRDTFRPRADAAPTLRELRARGIPTGLVTNCSSEIPELLNESELEGLFDAEVFSAICGLRKPDPAIFELAASRLGVAPEACLFIGDGDDHELDGAAEAGMRAVLLKPGDTRPPKSWAGEEISSLTEALALVV